MVPGAAPIRHNPPKPTGSSPEPSLLQAGTRNPEELLEVPARLNYNTVSLFPSANGKSLGFFLGPVADFDGVLLAVGHSGHGREVRPWITTECFM